MNNEIINDDEPEIDEPEMEEQSEVSLILRDVAIFDIYLLYWKVLIAGALFSLPFVILWLFWFIAPRGLR
jgi:hypothetical protein